MAYNTYYKGGKNKKVNQTRSSGNTMNKSVSSILQLPFAVMKERGIRKDTCEFFNVRMSLSEETREPSSYYFPYYDQKGKLTGWKVRDLTKEKHDDFHFTTIGKVGVDCQLFGQEHIKTSRSKTVYFLEGEADVLSAWQVMNDSLKGTKWEGKLIPAFVGLSCGTGNAVEASMHNLEFLRGFETICLGFDNDQATNKEREKGIKKGVEATEDVATSLMADNINIIEYADGMKDASDYLQEGKEFELKQLFMDKGRKYVAEKIITASNLSYEEVFAPKPIGVAIEGLPKLTEKTKGFREGELSVFTALSGVGKSSYVCEIAYSIANAGKRVGMIFLEEEAKETVQRLIARRMGVNYNSFKFTPEKYGTDEERREAFDWVMENDRFLFLDHFGSLAVDKLMSKIKAMVYMHKVDFIILDHLTLVVSGLDVQNERKMLDLVLTELAAFCASNPVGILAVSHLNRDAADEIRGISKLEEPMWVCVKKEDLRGSSSLEALAWNVFGIDFEVMPDRTRGRTRITVLKNRPTGFLGQCDIIKMNDITGAFEDASGEGMNYG